jgi:hypothetical protein
MPRPLLLPYPALALVMGLAYLLGDPERTNTPSVAPAPQPPAGPSTASSQQPTTPPPGASTPTAW